jgi:hypothetical protein
MVGSSVIEIVADPVSLSDSLPPEPVRENVIDSLGSSLRERLGIQLSVTDIVSVAKSDDVWVRGSLADQLSLRVIEADGVGVGGGVIVELPVGVVLPVGVSGGVMVDVRVGVGVSGGVIVALVVSDLDHEGKDSDSETDSLELNVGD